MALECGGCGQIKTRGAHVWRCDDCQSGGTDKGAEIARLRALLATAKGALEGWRALDYAFIEGDRVRTPRPAFCARIADTDTVLAALKAEGV